MEHSWSILYGLKRWLDKHQVSSAISSKSGGCWKVTFAPLLQ